MSKNKHLTTAAIILFSGGVLAASALLVPSLVNTSAIAKNSPAAQSSSNGVVLTGNTIPVLKVEAPVPKSTVSEELLDGMTEAEIRHIYELLNKPGNDPRVIGRERSKAEVNRSMVLSDRYVYDGLRPERPLPLKAGQAEFYLDLESHTLYYPERNLTDEELLQQIDWSFRTGYIASRYNVTAPPLPQKFKKSEVEVLAAESVHKLFDADVSKLETIVMLNEPGYGIPSTWSVQSAPYKASTLRGQGKEYWQYDVLIDPDTGTVVDTTATNVALTRTPINAAAAAAVRKDASWIQKATRILTDKQGETRAIVKASLTDTEANNKRGMVAVRLLLEDGSSYTAEMRYPDQSLRCLTYEAADKAR